MGAGHMRAQAEVPPAAAEAERCSLPSRPALPASITASARTWMAERTCQQDLPGRPESYDAEPAATLTQLVWGALYLEAP